MLKALLVDDEDIIVQGLKVLIDWNAEGFEVAATASDGQEALDYLKRHRVDLVVMDVKMPGMTGLDLLETVQAAHVSDAKFVILSGYGEFDYAQRALRFGCVDYLLKPVREQSLVAVLRKISRISEGETPEKACEGARPCGHRDDFARNGAEETPNQSERQPIRKENLNRLISAIRKNDRNEILTEADALFCEMRRGGLACRDVSANIYYLLFRLTEIASELDGESNPEEVIRFISDASFDNRVRKGSREHLERFALEYADYLSQLGRTESTGILRNIEREIRERYPENLTLRNLGRKYFINSAYLGQIFRKKYGMSFKGYLANYRMNQAARELLQTRKSVSQIALEVGYRDTDYFISKFIEAKGCTPSRFRKSGGGGRGGL